VIIMSMMKRKKVTKYRGSKTHGCGSMKKRRGAGHRGGRGRAGSGKRGDGKKPMYWKEKAAKGFSSQLKADTTINVGHLSSCIITLTREGFADEKSGMYVLDMTKLKVTKLLGAGNTALKFDITVDTASPKAIEKIEKAGGKVTVKYMPEDEETKQANKLAKNEKTEAAPKEAKPVKKKEAEVVEEVAR
jgi:large subunit ribosomal protein L15